ncbi:MAG: hypothetical protein NTV97_33920 [Alphaproteobacteria bacterium]|nr:hypothetical protein [Alphaproteobacteria bacterium]
MTDALPTFFMRLPIPPGLSARKREAIEAHRIALQSGEGSLADRVDAIAYVLAFMVVGSSRRETPEAVLRRIAHDKLGRALTYALKHRPEPAERMRLIP